MSNSLIGSVSLTNKLDGLYLGKVNIQNFDASNNQILYDNNGNISGHNLSSGLSVNDNNLITVGNPAIQLVSNSIYINDNTTDIQIGVNNATQGDVIYISSGSYGGDTLTITDKYNICLSAPSTRSTICELPERGISITGTSENIRINNLQIKGNSIISGVGRHTLDNCVFTGTIDTPITITIGENVNKFITISNCEFDQYCTIIVAATFASAIYFINCNISSATLSLLQSQSQQVIFSNCSGIPDTVYNFTPVGINTTVSQRINMYASNFNMGNGKFVYNANGQGLYLHNTYIYDKNGNPGTNQDCLCSDSSEFPSGGTVYKPIGGYSNLTSRYIETGQQSSNASGAGSVPLTLYLNNNISNFIPNLETYIKCIFNFDLNNDDTVLFQLIDNINNIQSYNIQCQKGYQTVPITFPFTADANSIHSIEIRAYTIQHIISITPFNYYNIEIQQVSPLAPPT